LCHFTTRWDQRPATTSLIKVRQNCHSDDQRNGLTQFLDLIRVAEMSLVICDNEDKCKSLLNNSPPCLKQLVHMKPISQETIELAKRKGINTLSFDYVEKLGAEKKHRPVVCRVYISKCQI
jgi:hypothetical protein